MKATISPGLFLRCEEPGLFCFQPLEGRVLLMLVNRMAMKKDRIIWAFLTAACLLGIGAIVICSVLRPPDDSAKRPKCAIYPQRIISLGPSVTKGLYLLGVGDRLTANTIYCTVPPEARRKEKIGTVVEVSIEKVLSLNPDLVLATSLTNANARKKLENSGARVVTFPMPENFGQMCEQFLELGRLVGKEEHAEKIVEIARSKTFAIKKSMDGLSKPKVLVQVGARPLFVATGRCFVNDYIEFAGGINIARDAKEGIYSREQVLKANPDVIIITTMGIVGNEEKEAWGRYETLSATKSDQIHIVDSDRLTSPTPASFVEALEDIVHILHPGQIR